MKDEGRGTRYELWGTRYEVRGTRYELLGTRYEVRNRFDKAVLANMLRKWEWAMRIYELVLALH